MARSLKPHVLVGRNIAKLRYAKGLTQEQLSEKANMDRRSLQRIESGNWNMTVDYLDRLRRSLGCTWSDLIGFLDKQNP